jgi:hypothetical protein
MRVIFPLMLTSLMLISLMMLSACGFIGGAGEPPLPTIVPVTSTTLPHPDPAIHP